MHVLCMQVWAASRPRGSRHDAERCKFDFLLLCMQEDVRGLKGELAAAQKELMAAQHRHTAGREQMQVRLVLIASA